MCYPNHMGEPETCFIIMPISRPKHLADRYLADDHFAHVLDDLLIPAVEAAGFEARPPARRGTTNIQAGIINDLQNADLVLADLSALNPNVFLELGIRSALDKPVCLVWDGADKLPFDTNTILTHEYEAPPTYGLASEIDKVTEHINDTVKGNPERRNPLWQFFGTGLAAGTELGHASINPDDASIGHKVDAILSLLQRESSGASSRMAQQRVNRLIHEPGDEFVWSAATEEQLSSQIRDAAGPVLQPGTHIAGITFNPDGRVVIGVRGTFTKTERSEIRAMVMTMDGVSGVSFRGLRSRISED